MVVGFFGGSDLRPVGSVKYFLDFYKTIKNTIDWEEAPCKESKKLICDRLYKRYVRNDDFDLTVDSMHYIFSVFKNNKSGGNIADKFSDLYSNFLDSVDNFKYFQIHRGNTNLLRIIITDMPQCLIDTNRSLEKLDTWDGPPFWTRFYLKELMDQGKPIPELPF